MCYHLIKPKYSDLINNWLIINISRSSDDFDNHGCLKSRNNAAKKFNKQLKALCKKLRAAMKDATVVYVDIFAIKYDLIANAKLYGKSWYFDISTSQKWFSKCSMSVF